MRGFLLPCLFSFLPSQSSAHRKNQAFPENFPDVGMFHMLLVGRKKHQPVSLLKTQPKGLESWNFPRLFCEAHEFVLSHFRSATLPPFLPLPVLGGLRAVCPVASPAPEIHLSWVIALTMLSFRHGASLSSEECVVESEGFCYRTQELLMNTLCQIPTPRGEMNSLV